MQFSGLPAGQVSLSVYGENRLVNLTGTRFTDTFGPNAVHIYSN
jgi:hypothetical protein